MKSLIFTGLIAILLIITGCTFNGTVTTDDANIDSTVVQIDTILPDSVAVIDTIA